MNALEDRVESIDVLRGFSLLGILLMNIVSFGLPFISYVMPHIYGGITGANLTFWLVSQTLFEGKMRCLFSMLFGASMLLLTSRAEARGAGIEAADIYYRRVLWLILIGLVHAHLIWYGDILYAYGVIGLLLFPLRKLPARALITAGAIVVVVHSLMNVGAMFGIGELKESAETAFTVPAAARTFEQKKALSEWENLQAALNPPADQVEREIKARRGTWLESAKVRAAAAARFEFKMFFQFMFLDVFGMLLLGMGLFKAGVFDASRGYGFYATLAIAGFALGAPLNYWAAVRWMKTGFALPDWFGYINATADPGRFAVAMGYTGLIMLICKSGVLRWARFLLASVGRTALSNYLLTSILCSFFFEGYGLGWFARLERAQLLWVVLGVWIVNLTVSPVWLRYFRYGPAEWLWRSLTHGRKQSMRLRSTPADA